jgi:excisionase family DNA binding protein
MLLDARKAAELLGVSDQTLRRWAREGQIPAFKWGRAYRFDVDALLRVGQATSPEVQA